LPPPCILSKPPCFFQICRSLVSQFNCSFIGGLWLALLWKKPIHLPSCCWRRQVGTNSARPFKFLGLISHSRRPHILLPALRSALRGNGFAPKQERQRYRKMCGLRTSYGQGGMQLTFLPSSLFTDLRMPNPFPQTSSRRHVVDGVQASEVSAEIEAA
jgi:hypothetical protein